MCQKGEGISETPELEGVWLQPVVIWRVITLVCSCRLGYPLLLKTLLSLSPKMLWLCHELIKNSTYEHQKQVRAVLYCTPAKDRIKLAVGDTEGRHKTTSWTRLSQLTDYIPSGLDPRQQQTANPALTLPSQPQPQETSVLAPVCMIFFHFLSLTNIGIHEVAKEIQKIWCNFFCHLFMHDLSKTSTQTLQDWNKYFLISSSVFLPLQQLNDLLSNRLCTWQSGLLIHIFSNPQM